MSQVIEIEQPFDAPADRAWHACSHVEGLQNWQADLVRGQVAPNHALRLRWPALGAELDLTVTEVEPGRRVALRSGDSTVEIRVGADRVTLTQDGLTEGDEAEGVASSWRVALAMLSHYLEQHPDRQRRVDWFVQPMTTTAAAAHVFFSESTALRAWLTQSGSVGETGTPVSLRLAWGEELTGKVLCHTPGRDLAVSWRERQNSVLVLRTLPSPYSDEERLVAAVWSRWENGSDEARADAGLTLAIHQLAYLLDNAGSA